MATQITKPVAAGSKKTALHPAIKAIRVETQTTELAQAPATAKARPATATKEAVRSLFVLADIARPVSGSLLFAHTMAALQVLGMATADRKAVRTAALQAFTGARAIKYHAGEKGNMEEIGDKIRLTVAGFNFFGGRLSEGKVHREDIDAFATLFATGKVPARLNVKPNHVVPVGLSV